MKAGLKKFFPAKGGAVIGPSAMLSILVLATTIQFEVAPHMSPVFFMGEIAAVGGLYYSMHWKRRNTQNLNA